MYTDFQKFSGITDSDKGIRLPWIDDKKDSLYKENGYHTGIDIYADNVYSFASGVVISVGKTDKFYAVTVQYDSNIALRYLNLMTVSVSAGQAVQAGFNIGAADKYVHFEYVTKSKDNSMWSVRIGTETYYKHDPMKITGGQV
ncbi:MAG: M23 family metallopeptidase [Clostridium sp.]|nr:M23 family metallopeptidase [Clostridium sp.]